MQTNRFIHGEISSLITSVAPRVKVTSANNARGNYRGKAPFGQLRLILYPSALAMSNHQSRKLPAAPCTVKLEDICLKDIILVLASKARYTPPVFDHAS